jgi:hypothetical protein
VFGEADDLSSDSEDSENEAARQSSVVESQKAANEQRPWILIS